MGIAQALLARGAAAWNEGDLDAFMSDYTEDATFVTRREVVRGRDAIRALYAPRFAPGFQRGTLTFENVQTFVLGERTLHVVAFYVLTGLPSGTQRGPTSLVLVRESSGRWRIAHDHSS